MGVLFENQGWKFSVNGFLARIKNWDAARGEAKGDRRQDEQGPKQEAPARETVCPVCVARLSASADRHPGRY